MTIVHQTQADYIKNIFETLTVDSLKEALDEEGDKVPKSLREFC